jgi:hypothetical protein
VAKLETLGPRIAELTTSDPDIACLIHSTNRFTLIAAASRRQNPLVSQANRVEPAGALELIRRL